MIERKLSACMYTWCEGEGGSNQSKPNVHAVFLFFIDSQLEKESDSASPIVTWYLFIIHLFPALILNNDSILFLS